MLTWFLLSEKGDPNFNFCSTISALHHPSITAVPDMLPDPIPCSIKSSGESTRFLFIFLALHSPSTRLTHAIN